MEEKKKQSIYAILKSYGISPTDGEIKKLVEHVDKHEYFLGLKVNFHFTWNDALFSWYENIFTKIYTQLSNKVLRACFPQKTDMQLFFDISHEWYMLGTESISEPFVKDAVIKLIDTSNKGKLKKLVCKLFV